MKKQKLASGSFYPDITDVISGLNTLNNLYHKAPKISDYIPFMKKGRPRGSSKPAKYTGSKIGMTGSITKTRTKTKKKTKSVKKINVVKEIRKIKKKAAIERNSRICVTIYKDLAGGRITHLTNERSGWSQVAIANTTDCERVGAQIKKMYFDAATEGINQSVDLTVVVGTSFKLKWNTHWNFKNNDEFPCWLYVYDFQCVEDGSDNVLQVMESMVGDQLTGHSANDIQYDMRYFPSDCRNMKKYWKVVDKQKVYLGPGAEYQYHFEGNAFNYVPDQNDLEPNPYLRGKSHILVAFTEGVPCHDNSTKTLVGTTPLEQVDYTIRRSCVVSHSGDHNTEYYYSYGADTVYGDLSSVLSLTNPVVAGVTVDTQAV